MCCSVCHSDADMVTETTIFDIGNLTTLTSPPRTRSPSMPSIPSLQTHNFDEVDAVDFMVKGIQLQKGPSLSPSFKESASGKCPNSTTQNYDSSISDRCIAPRIEEVCSNLDALSSSILGQRPSSDDGSENTKHILPFVKTASPVIYGHNPVLEQEPLLEKKAGLHR